MKSSIRSYLWHLKLNVTFNKIIRLINFAIVSIISTFSILYAQIISPSTIQTIDHFSPQSYKSKEIHQSIKVHILGSGKNRAYLFVPDSPHLKQKMPVIFLHHGWLGWDPKNFGALIDHFVRMGNIIIYPAYQDSPNTPPTEVTDNAGKANKNALNFLSNALNIQIDTSQILYFGFSMGAAITLNLALDYKLYQLPKPSTLLLVGMGDAYHVLKNAPSIIKPLNQLPKDLPIIMMTGEDDPIGMPTARKLYAQICHIKPNLRPLMILPTSHHGNRKINAGHGSIGAPDSRYELHNKTENSVISFNRKESFEPSGSLNQLDFYGYWKIIDQTMVGLNAKKLSPIVFEKNNPLQLSLGNWDNGLPFNQLYLKDYCR